MLYTEIFDNIPGAGCSLDDWNTAYEGCKCTRNQCDEPGQCNCLKHLKKRNYIKTENGLILDLNLNQPISECNQECECTDCSNRLVQNGPKSSLEVFDTLSKGKGLRTGEFIPAGSFVIEYLGELVGHNQAELLLEQRSLEPNNYIMFLREFFSFDSSLKTVIIDAKNYSNKARFINHSCEPNLLVVPVRIDNMLPHAALFAKRDIQPFEELTYDYNQSECNFNSQETRKDLNLKTCHCGSPNCKGYLPNTK